MKLVKIKHTEKGWMYRGNSKWFNLLFTSSTYAYYRYRSPYRDYDIPALLGALSFTLFKQDKFL